MRTFKLTLECYDDGKPALTLTVDETVIGKVMAKEIINVIFTNHDVLAKDE